MIYDLTFSSKLFVYLIKFFNFYDQKQNDLLTYLNFFLLKINFFKYSF